MCRETYLGFGEVVGPQPDSCSQPNSPAPPLTLGEPSSTSWAEVHSGRDDGLLQHVLQLLSEQVSDLEMLIAGSQRNRKIEGGGYYTGAYQWLP